MEIETEEADIPAENLAYLDLPLEEPTVHPVMFNVYVRKCVTFIKFKTPQFEGNERRQLEVEFLAAICEMLETIWEADPTAILIPWEQD